jgi:S1-C subfamily serine protease
MTLPDWALLQVPWRCPAARCSMGRDAVGINAAVDGNANGIGFAVPIQGAVTLLNSLSS